MNGVREVPLTQGKVALVDEADWEQVCQYRWTAYQRGSTWYAKRDYQLNAKRYSQPLHRFILNTDAPRVDHKNRDGLDCRRENLRPATHGQNMTNSKMSVRNTSGYRGVTRSRHDWPRPWQAKIKKDQKTRYLGVFATAIEAAQAYDEAARVTHGEFAVLNFPGKGEKS